MYNNVEDVIKLILNRNLFREELLDEKLYLEVEKSILKKKNKSNEILSS